MSIKIGILGLAGAGKSTFAELLQTALLERGHTFSLDSYARPLKVLASVVFGCTLEQLEDRVFKETPQDICPVYAEEAAYNLLEYILKFDVQEYQKATALYSTVLGGRDNISPREFLQLFGTDVVRAVREDAWVQYLQRKEGNLIVPDVRFENELCDVNILIMREVDVPRPVHPSEQYAWDLEYDLEVPVPKFTRLVDNDTTTTLEELNANAVYLANAIITDMKL